MGEKKRKVMWPREGMHGMGLKGIGPASEGMI